MNASRDARDCLEYAQAVPIVDCKYREQLALARDLDRVYLAPILLNCELVSEFVDINLQELARASAVRNAPESRIAVMHCFRESSSSASRLCLIASPERAMSSPTV